MYRSYVYASVLTVETVLYHASPSTDSIKTGIITLIAFITDHLKRTQYDRNNKSDIEKGDKGNLVLHIFLSE